MPNLSSAITSSSTRTKSDAGKIKHKSPYSTLRNYRIRTKLRRAACYIAGRILSYVLSIFLVISSTVFYLQTALEVVIRNYEPSCAPILSLIYLRNAITDKI